MKTIGGIAALWLALLAVGAFIAHSDNQRVRTITTLCFTAPTRTEIKRFRCAVTVPAKVQVARGSVVILSRLP